MAVRFEAAGMVTKNMAEALRFYRLLGLEFPEGGESEGHVEAITPANGCRLMWDTVEVIHSFDPDWTEPTGQRLALGFKCDSPEEVDATYRKILDHGFRGYKEPWDAFWGQRYAVVIDPDGNHVDLFC